MTYFNKIKIIKIYLKLKLFKIKIIIFRKIII